VSTRHRRVELAERKRHFTDAQDQVVSNVRQDDGYDAQQVAASGTSVVAAELGAMFVGPMLPTPLYPLYRASLGFGNLTLTSIYAVYVLGNLIALLGFGRLSDQIGRRLVTLSAVGIGLASTTAFILADGTILLFVARILSGFATGLASGTAAAWLAELQPERNRAVAAVATTVANFIGLAAGSVLAGTLAALAPWPLRLCYIVYFLTLLAVGAAVLYPRETVENGVRRLADLSLRPRLGVPAGIRLQFASPAAAGFATFALIGFYAALIPSVLGESLREASPLVAGTVVFGLFLVAAVTTALTGKLGSRTAMLCGLALLLPSLALLMGAELMRSMALLAVAAVVGGVASAFGYRGGLEVINSIAPADRRAEVVSSYLIAVYAGNALPVISIGLLSTVAAATSAHLAFATVIAILTATAFVAGAKYSPPDR
jgi:MFS family permease